MEKVLITGNSGFIGMHLSESLLKEGNQVYGVDNMNDYYDVNLKKARLNRLSGYSNFSFSKVDISDLDTLDKIFKKFGPNKVVNLAAQAGVRYSIENPHAYIQSNVSGFMNILELCKKYEVDGLIYASSSSVYGGNEKIPFSEIDNVNKPISIYAASKKANELMAHTYHHLFGLHTTGLRFFTVYGPWGRPDMAMYMFADNIFRNIPISVFNHGEMMRDFTFIDDIVMGTKSALKKNFKCEVFNLGNNRCEDLMEMIKLIEMSVGQKADFNFMDIQPGDVKKTFADIAHAKEKLGYNPQTSIKVGIPKFINWFKSYKNI